MTPVPTDNQIKSWLDWSADQLSSIIDDSRQEAKWLLSAMLNCNLSELQLYHSEISKESAEKFEKWIKRRSANEPAQYIAGWTEFYGRRFNVTKDVLIPRQETERLVDVAIYTFQELDHPRLIDIGTGSGCLAISVAAELPHADVKGQDISLTSLAIAGENAALNKLSNVTFMQSDFLNDYPPQPIYNGLLMNPPYIPEDEMDSLMAIVRDNEPIQALTDHHDGLTFYRHLAKHAEKWVFSGGWLIMEVGLGDHPQKAADYFLTNNFSQLEFIADFNGDNRVLKVQVQ
jgi:release factor glutamine methyltransferase